MSYNLANLDKDQRDKVDVDLQASSVAFKERYGMPFNLREIENSIPAHLHQYFSERLAHYRSVSKTLGKLSYQPKE